MLTILEVFAGYDISAPILELSLASVKNVSFAELHFKIEETFKVSDIRFWIPIGSNVPNGVEGAHTKKGSHAPHVY